MTRQKYEPPCAMVVATLALGFLAQAAIAQTWTGSNLLTSEQISSAIYQGITHPGQPQGLVLSDAGSQFGQFTAALSAASGQQKPWDQAPASGFKITIYTPKSWIAQQASDAAQQGRTFTTQNVSDDMLRQVIRVTAMPSTPPPAGIGLNFGQDVSSVGDIKLADASRKIVIESSNRSPFSFQDLSGLLVEFSLDDLSRVRQYSSEFYVSVVGPNNSHDFKIKNKHLAKLPL
jgi:hypothetical protein